MKMAIDKLLEDVSLLGIGIEEYEGNLKITGDSSQLTEGLIQSIRDNKISILNYIELSNLSFNPCLIHV